MTRLLTPAELDALTAWWICGRHIGHTATFLGKSRQTIANTLNTIRRLEDAPDTVEVALNHMADIERHKPVIMGRKAA